MRWHEGGIAEFELDTAAAGSTEDFVLFWRCDTLYKGCSICDRVSGDWSLGGSKDTASSDESATLFSVVKQSEHNHTIIYLPTILINLSNN